MHSILNYQDRCSRAQGEDYTFERTNFIIGNRVGRVVQGEYVDVSEHANSRLHYDDNERQLVAVYPVDIVPEPSVEEVSVEAMEKLVVLNTYSPEELELLKVCPAVKDLLHAPMRFELNRG